MVCTERSGNPKTNSADHVDYKQTIEALQKRKKTHTNKQKEKAEKDDSNIEKIASFLSSDTL